MKILYQLIIIFSTSLSLYSQDAKWINYTNGQEISSIVVDENVLWIGTNGGLVKLNSLTKEKTFYNKANSGLPNNNILSLALDRDGSLWIGTYESKLAEFNGTNWTVYNSSNSGLPYKNVKSLAIDRNGNKWIGTGGVAVFNKVGIVSVEKNKLDNLPGN